jgi:autotransporter adhesin
MKKFVSLFVGFILLSTIAAQAGDIKAIKTNESFEEVARIDQLQQIRVSNPPVTQYTPKNLRKQQLLEFQGRNTQNGSMTYWSTNISDYDTKIIKSLQDGNSYYIEDNTGKRFQTGEHVDLTPIKQDIGNIQSGMQTMNQRMNSYGQDITRLNNKIDDVQHNMYTGLATVTALTSLHPNPRSTSFAEVSLGAGLFRDQCAGAAGLFIHPTDWSMLQGGFAFGNQDNYAGYVGATFSLPKIRFKKK